MYRTLLTISLLATSCTKSTSDDDDSASRNADLTDDVDGGSDNDAGSDGDDDTGTGGGSGDETGGEETGGEESGGEESGGEESGGEESGGEESGGEESGGDDSDIAYTWTDGPEAAPCTPTSSDSSLVALSGVLLTTDGPENGAVVFNQITGTIVCAGTDCDTDGATQICTEGIISAGLIDSHNHMQYNALGPWEHEELFTDRYDWQSDDGYDDFRTAYDVIDPTYRCEIMKWAEIRSLVGGSTAVVGSSGGACINPLIRNLEEGSAASGLDDYDLSYSSGRVRSSYDEGDIKEVGVHGDAIINHVAEGINGSVTAEISHMLDIGMSGPGQVYVHATDATTEQLAEMADDGTAIAWSPRSNLDLYAATTPADVAHRLGVPITLAPDWTWSGSMSPAHELSCANEWLHTRSSGISDVTLWSWTTAEAARVLNLDGVLGDLAPGLKADITVFSWSDQPYRTVIEGDPRDVELVLVDGKALYGKTEWVTTLAESPEWCETIDACGIGRTVCVKTGTSGDDAQTATDIEDILHGVLSPVGMPVGLDYAKELFGLFLCEDTRDSCNMAADTDTDTDGDGIDDEADACPTAYDPLQRDHDGDGLGDVCDACPLAADMTECTHTPGDIDGDGYATEIDNCPWLYNADQSDADEDGLGDVCDPCPEEASDDGSCSFTIPEMRDPDSEVTVSVGTFVKINNVVVTGIRPDVGFYIQDTAADTYGGIFVYDSGEYSSGAISVGVQISITGVYEDYFGLAELTGVEVLSEAPGTIPDPIEVADPCTIGTDGSLSATYQSMVVTVRDIIVSNANPDTPEDYGEFEVNDCLRFDDQLTDTLVPQPDMGTTFSRISGILTQTFGNAKVEPRGPEDIDE